MAAKPSITIVGPGRLGRTLAEALANAAYPLSEIVFRNTRSLQKRAGDFVSSARLVPWEKARFNADIIWLCVPDAQIEPTARSLKSLHAWKNKIVFHSSGAIASDALSALRERGAAVASVHPLMTFVRGSQPVLKDVPFGLEGDTRALRIAGQIIKNLGADAFLVKKQDKVLYHAWGTFLSPLLLAFLVTAEQVVRATRVTSKNARKKMLPIAMQTLSNYASLGAANSFSGPLVRGDVATVRDHLKALREVPEARQVYIALSKLALLHLPVRNRKRIEKLLK